MSNFFGTTTAPKAVPHEVEREVDAVADRAGFRQREPLREPPRRQRGTTKQLHNLTMKLDIDDAETFIRYCERERLSYREAFSRLVATIRE
jgi:hypothetical protein